MWGADYEQRSKDECGKSIAKHIIELFPEATPQQVKRLLGSVVGEPTEKTKRFVRMLTMEAPSRIKSLKNCSYSEDDSEKTEERVELTEGAIQ